MSLVPLSYTLKNNYGGKSYVMYILSHTKKSQFSLARHPSIRSRLDALPWFLPWAWVEGGSRGCHTQNQSQAMAKAITLDFIQDDFK